MPPPDPTTPPGATSGPASSPPAATAPAPSLSIVALDDDEDFRQYLRSALEAEGHEVRDAATAEEFFTACEERLPDLVLLDMKMGHDSGEQVLAEIRRRWPRLCV